MNKIKLIFSLVAIAMAVAGMLSCESEKDGEPDAQAELLKSLAGTWTVHSVLKDNVDVTDAFAGMAITFSADKKFTVTAPVSPIWPASGTFTLAKTSSWFEILREDGVDITISNLQPNVLILSFDYVASNARQQSVSGEFIFSLKK